ncbi:hypothetical protein M0804_008964 [Polistes exclamans]|nr:hypothetical protein M0804_008964 [Polistes exclamans]
MSHATNQVIPVAHKKLEVVVISTSNKLLCIPKTLKKATIDISGLQHESLLAIGKSSILTLLHSQAE